MERFTPSVIPLSHVVGEQHMLEYQAAICCILVSHQKISLKFVWVGGHYHYNIIRQPQKSLAPGLARPRSL